VLADAARRRKRVTFSYTNARGISAPHAVEPYGMFLFDGRWYAVGRDADANEERTYTVARMSDIGVNSVRPKSTDFERPTDFDIAAFSRLAFEYGADADRFEATLRFAPEAAWRAPALAQEHGDLERADDGSVLWRVEARDQARLLRFVVENGPGLSLEEPRGAIEALSAGLAEVSRLHG